MKYVDPNKFEPKPFVTLGMGVILVLLVIAGGFLTFVTAVTSYHPEDEVIISVIMGSVCLMFGVTVWLIKNLIPWLVYTGRGKQVYCFHRSNRESDALWYTYEPPIFIRGVNGKLFRLGEDGVYRNASEDEPNKDDVIAQAPFLKLAVGGWLRWAREGHRSKAMFAHHWEIDTWDGAEVTGWAKYEWNGKRSHCGPYTTKITEDAGVLLKRMKKYEHPRHTEELLEQARQEQESLQEKLDRLGMVGVFMTGVIDREGKMKMKSPYASRDRRFLADRYGQVFSDEELGVLRQAVSGDIWKTHLEAWINSGDIKFKATMRTKHDIKPVEALTEL